MWRLLALLMLTAPAAAQTVTVDLGALDGVGRARRHLVARIPPLLAIEAPARLEALPVPGLTPHPVQSDAATPSAAVQAVLALPIHEPPRPMRMRAMPIELARFMPTSPLRGAPHLPARIQPAAMPVLDAVRLLLAFAPDLESGAPNQPVALREAMVPVLAAFPVLDRVAALAADLPKLAPVRSASLHFAPTAASLGESDRAALDGMAAQLERDKSRRVQLLVSLQSGDDPDAARRLALARMLAVRAYLASRGIAASRLDARATVAAGSSDAVRIALLD
ncbi:MAG: hypothetical protein JWM77_1653 [Rhodospirillales bacterium]|nr:hypothetical protein [Rhodospirillales bacterium]